MDTGYGFPKEAGSPHILLPGMIWTVRGRCLLPSEPCRGALEAALLFSAAQKSCVQPYHMISHIFPSGAMLASDATVPGHFAGKYFVLPECHVAALQLPACYVSLEKGLDVDKQRSLAKVVTGFLCV